MYIEGTITFAGVNKKGWYSVAVKTAQGDKWIGFGHKNATHAINGVNIAKGMEFKGEVDENNYNAFVSGTVSWPANPSGSGSVSGGKGGYDAVGNAVGGAMNRVNALIASGTVPSVGATSVALASYLWSEMCVEAAKSKRILELHKLMAGVDVNDFNQVATQWKVFMGGGQQPTQPAQQPVQQQPTQQAPVQQAPTQQAPVANNLPENFMSSGDFEDDAPF